MNDGVNADMAKIDVIMNEEAGWREREKNKTDAWQDINGSSWSFINDEGVWECRYLSVLAVTVLCCYYHIVPQLMAVCNV